MYDPTVLACALEVAQAVRTSAECNAARRASHSGLVEQLANSRDVIERSCALLKKLQKRDGQ
jgi:hypothetical protein